jgi:Mg2+ and Co2+ transporter CorA
MTYEQMQEILASLVTRQANHEAQVMQEMAELRLNLTKTEAIANSNARAIEAAANEGAENRRLAQNTQRQLTELVQVVSQFVEATNTRLSGLENR